MALNYDISESGAPQVLVLAGSTRTAGEGKYAVVRFRGKQMTGPEGVQGWSADRDGL